MERAGRGLPERDAADDVGALEEGRGEAGKGGCVEGRTRRPFPAGLSASATDKSRGLGGNYFPRRGVGRSPAYQTHPAKPNRPRAVQKRAWRRGHDGLFPPVFRHPLRTNQGGSGEIISPGGAWGGAPHTKPIPRSRTGPALFRSERGVGGRGGLFPPVFRHPLRTNQGGSGEIISPGGARGGAPHSKHQPRRCYFWLTSDQDQMTRPTMDFCQSPSKSSMRLRTRGGLSAALSE